MKRWCIITLTAWGVTAPSALAKCEAETATAVLRAVESSTGTDVTLQWQNVGTVYVQYTDVSSDVSLIALDDGQIISFGHP